MSKIAALIFGAVFGGLAAVVFIIVFFGWGLETRDQLSYLDPSRADYVDLILTVATIFLGGIGLAVTVGALVIGLVALKTLREIKSEAATSAEVAAADKIAETMKAELAPSVKVNVEAFLPPALKTALIDDQTGHRILSDMAKSGALDEVLERVVVRMQTGGGISDPDQVNGDNEDEDEA